MRKSFACAGLAALMVMAGCGSSSSKSACDLVSTSAVTAQAKRLVGAGVGAVTATPEETSGLSVCRFRGKDLSVRVSIDSNSHAPRRFFNRLDEQWEFYAGSEDRKPVLVSGVGDDQTALGGAGAYWIAANHQLIVLSRGRLVVVTVSSGKDAAALASAKRLARMVTRSGGGTGETPRELATGGDRVEVFEPLNGVLLRAATVTVHGAVSPATARVEVNGRPVRLRPGGFFTKRVSLARGANTIRVTASRAGRTFDSQRIRVRRGASPAEEARAVARRFDGHLPDLRTQRLDVALAILRELGLRHSEATVQPGRVVPSRWTVCSTKPSQGERVRRGRQVLLFVAPGRLDKPSTTDCVSD